mgnify:CR=1 FL=1
MLRAIPDYVCKAAWRAYVGGMSQRRVAREFRLARGSVTSILRRRGEPTRLGRKVIVDEVSPPRPSLGLAEWRDAEPLAVSLVGEERERYEELRRTKERQLRSGRSECVA